MSEKSPLRPYAELMNEFRAKVEFLKARYGLEQQVIAADIGENPANLSRYLDRNKAQPCRLTKLIKMLSILNDRFSQEFQQIDLTNEPVALLQEQDTAEMTSESPQYIFARIKRLQQEIEALNNLLQAFTEITLEFIARSEERPASQLFEEIDRKKTEISKRPDTE
jgi:hypothetical protein